MKITKAVIPAAGFGTRFLPATKAIPKEMIPIIDIPTIEYIVREAIDAGITDFLIIINNSKDSIKQHFGKNMRLEQFLLDKNDLNSFNIINNLPENVKINYVIQEEQKGLGHAILCAKEFVGNDDFAVLLGDDVVLNNEYPAIKQLCDFYEKYPYTVVGVQKVNHEDTKLYGIVSPDGDFVNNFCQISSIIEKPFPDNAPSDYAVLGRYVLTNKIFDKLKSQKPGKGGEIQLTDSIMRLLADQKVYAYNFIGTRYDVGSKIGFIKATIDYALQREDLKEEVLKYIKEKISD